MENKHTNINESALTSAESIFTVLSHEIVTIANRRDSNAAHKLGSSVVPSNSLC